MRFFLFVLFNIATTFSGAAQLDSLMADAEISLLSCRSGSEMYSTFGHTAIRINNPKTGTDIVYNYGVFDFDTPNFYMKFLRGQLPYKLSASPTSRFLRIYQYEKRTVLEQKLSLAPTQKVRLFEALTENIKPENAYYKYDFFFDNCTTRTIDVIRSVTGNITYARDIESLTFRDMLKRNLKSMPWTDFGVHLIVGAVTDKKTNRSQQHFLPIFLHNDLNGPTIVYEGMRKNMTNSDKMLLNFEKEDKIRTTQGTNWPLYLAILLLLLELMLWITDSPRLASIYDNTWMILMSLMGIVMAIMWWGTDHLATKQNYNLLWANLLFAPYLCLSGRIGKLVLGVLIVLMCALSVVNGCCQILPQYFLPAFGIFAAISILKLVRQLRARRNEVSKT